MEVQWVQANNNVWTETEGGFSGPAIARKFAQEATKNLSQSELTQLLEFLQNPHAARNYPKEETQTKLTKAIESFHENEPKISGEPADGLSFPGGPEEADLGIILHLKTGKHASNHFWDPKSVSISLLEEKGINNSSSTAS